MISSALALDQGEVVLALQVEPELAAIAEIAAEAEAGVGFDRAAPVEDVGDAPGGDAEVECKPAGAQVSRLDLAPQQPARMETGGMVYPLSKPTNVVGSQRRGCPDQVRA